MKWPNGHKVCLEGMNKRKGEGNVAKVFNVTGDCKPGLHYMVNIDERLKELKVLVDAGSYFTINRARQYGKTTTLRMFSRYLDDYHINTGYMVSFYSNRKKQVGVRTITVGNKTLIEAVI